MTDNDVPVLHLIPQPDGRPHPELLPVGRARQVRAEAGGEPLTVLRTRRSVLDCVRSPVWVMAGVTAEGELRRCPVTGAEEQDVDGGMLQMDPPAHTTYRRRVNAVFTSAAARRERGYAEAIARDLAEGLRGRKNADLVTEYVNPFSRSVICASLGVGDWKSILAGSDNAFSPVHMPGGVERADEGWLETYQFYGSVLAAGRARPGGTAAQLAAAFSGFLPVQVAHLLGNVGNGYPAARQSMRRTLWELLAHYRAGAARCATGLANWGDLVGLILNTRALYPIDLPRRAASDTWLDGQFFPAGSLVLPSLVAAATDPAYPAPPSGDIAFSLSRHRCPGAHLTRMWIRTASNVLFAVHPRAEVAGDAAAWEGDSLSAPRQITVTGLSR